MPDNPPLSKISGLSEAINAVHGEALRLASRLAHMTTDADPAAYSILVAALTDIVALDELLSGGQIHRVIWESEGAK